MLSLNIFWNCWQGAHQLSTIPWSVVNAAKKELILQQRRDNYKKRKLGIDNKDEYPIPASDVSKTEEKTFEECDISLFEPAQPNTEGDYIDV